MSNIFESSSQAKYWTFTTEQLHDLYQKRWSASVARIKEFFGGQKLSINDEESIEPSTKRSRLESESSDSKHTPKDKSFVSNIDDLCDSYMTVENEQELLSWTVFELINVGWRMSLDTKLIITAAHFLRRFYTKGLFVEYPPMQMITAALLLSAKAEACPSTEVPDLTIQLTNADREFYSSHEKILSLYADYLYLNSTSGKDKVISTSIQSPASTISESSIVSQPEQLLLQEVPMLSLIDFQLAIHHPHRELFTYFSEFVLSYLSSSVVKEEMCIVLPNSFRKVPSSLGGSFSYIPCSTAAKVLSKVTKSSTASNSYLDMDFDLDMDMDTDEEPGDQDFEREMLVLQSRALSICELSCLSDIILRTSPFVLAAAVLAVAISGATIPGVLFSAQYGPLFIYNNLNNSVHGVEGQIDQTESNDVPDEDRVYHVYSRAPRTVGEAQEGIRRVENANRNLREHRGSSSYVYPGFKSPTHASLGENASTKVSDSTRISSDEAELTISKLRGARRLLVGASAATLSVDTSVALFGDAWLPRWCEARGLSWNSVNSAKNDIIEVLLNLSTAFPLESSPSSLPSSIGSSSNLPGVSSESRYLTSLGMHVLLQRFRLPSFDPNNPLFSVRIEAVRRLRNKYHTRKQSAKNSQMYKEHLLQEKAIWNEMRRNLRDE